MTDLECLPEGLRGTRFYQPGARGFERALRRRIEAWLAARERLKG